MRYSLTKAFTLADGATFKKAAFILTEIRGMYPLQGRGLGRGGDRNSSELVNLPSLKASVSNNKKLDCFAHARNDKSCAKHTEKNLFASLEFAPRLQSFADVPLAQSAQSVRYPDFVRPQIRYSPIRLFTSKKAAFTLAEVLITLGVIGVVATVTLVPLINRINDKQYDSARKKVLATIGEAGRIIAVDGNINSAENTEDFVKNYLSQKLKIAKICDSNDLKQCGIPDKIKTLGGKNTIDMPKYHGFLLANGYSINISYNKNCKNFEPDISEDVNNYICFNVIFDTNGLKKPNTVGKDIGFMSLLYPYETNRVVAPIPAEVDISAEDWAQASQLCEENYQGNYTLPNLEEIFSMYYNRNLIEIDTSKRYVTSYSCARSGTVFVMHFFNPYGGCYWQSGEKTARCVKR